MQKTNASEGIPGEKCRVCGKQPARLCYGSVACGPCKTFFLRVATRKATYACTLGGNCVYPKSVCPACRYQRCLAAGLVPEKAGRRDGCNRRALEGTEELLFPKSPILPSLTEEVTRMVTVAFPSHFMTSTTTDDLSVELGRLLRVEEYCSADQPWIPLKHDFEFNVSGTMEESLWDPLKICPRVPIGLSASNDFDPFDNQMGGRCWARWLVYCADFLRETPEIWQLTPQDRGSFCIYACGILVPIQQFYHTFKNGYSGLLQGLGLGLNPNDCVEGGIPDFLKATGRELHEKIFPLLRRVRFTFEEFLIWKMVVIFTPGPIGLTDDSRNTIRVARQKYLWMLSKLLRQNQTENEAIQKMQALMHVHRWFEKYAHQSCLFGAKCFVMGGVQAGIHGRLIGDFCFARI